MSRLPVARVPAAGDLPHWIDQGCSAEVPCSALLCPVLPALLCYRSADPCKQLLCKLGFIAAATGLQSAARFYSGALLQVTHPVTQPPFALSWVS